MIENINYYFKKTPIVGSLVDCTIKDHLYALKELIITSLFAFLPIIVAIIVDRYTILNATISRSILNNINGGELFLYSTAILAPVFYTVMDERGEKRTFPNKSGAILVYGLVMIFSAIVFALKRANVNIKGNGIISDSVIIFLISLGLLYLVIVYNNSRTRKNPSQEMQDQENEFEKKYSQHRGQQ